MTHEKFEFYGIRMKVLVSTEQTGGRYCTIEMQHPPLVGPSEHIHPLGAETFYVMEGEYTFYVENEEARLGPGKCFCVPLGARHRYLVGASGGKVLVICPPGLERYFQKVSEGLKAGVVTKELEKQIARDHGQVFGDMTGHWQAKH